MKDPKAIRKAIMTARNIAAMVDPNFARVPLPQIGEPDAEEMRPPRQFAIGGPVLSAYNAAKKADYGMHPESGRAVEDFIGVPPDAFKTKVWGGIMNADPLEDAYSEQPSEKGSMVRQQLKEQFDPIRENLREIFGDHVTLYRHQGEVAGQNTGQRNTLSWSIDPKVAHHFAGVRPKPFEGYPEEEISRAEQDMERSGEAKIGNYHFVRNKEYPEYMDFYKNGDHITDTDSIRKYFEDHNNYVKELNDKNENKKASVVKADVPLDDIVWASNRAGQREFIVHNRPDAPHFIDINGKMPNSEMRQFSMGGRLPAQRSDNPFEQFQSQDPFSFDLPDHNYASGGGVDDHVVNNPMSVFPKPQRMWEEEMPGGAYLSMPDKADVTGHRAAQASIGIGEGGRPYFNASRDEVDETGSPGKGSALVKTNLFKQKAGWRWMNAPEGHEGTGTIVSVEHRGKHHYVMDAHFPKGVELSRYADAPSEPRLRPTTRGNVELGPQVGSILVRGREHPVHSHAIVREYGGRVGYADGGMPDDDQPTDYSAPDDMGLYSHGAATAASAPQAKASPEEFRSMLTNRGVKPSEFQASGYDEAFAGQPQVTREQVAEHFHQNRTPIEEKGFYTDNPNHESWAAIESDYWKKARELMARKVAYREENPDADMSNWGREESEALQREARERREALQASKEYINSAGTPHHEEFMLPGGENYREIALKHGGDDVRFKGVPNHLGGEPNILTHVLMKDRTDSEGKRLLHLDELQSDWAQQGREKGFSGPIDEDRYQNLAWRLDNSPEDEAEFEEMKKKIKGVPTAPYVTKTDDWVDLGLKRAMMEAAKGGHDKLAWSPGDVVADRYNLSKHIKDIHHEKNDDGTYNVMAYNHDGARVYDQDELAEKDVVDALGKEVAGKIFSGEGVGYEEAQARRKNAEDAHINFKKQLAESKLRNLIDGSRKENPEVQWDEVKIQMAQDIIANEIEKNPRAYAKEFGVEDEHEALSKELKDAYSATRNSPHSPYRDWRTLSGLDLTVGGEGMKKFYNEMLPKRLMKLAKQHDPDAKFSTSTITHPKDYYEDDEGQRGNENIPNVETDLPTLEMTPKMRESILKKGFAAYADGGEVEGYAAGGDVDPERVREYLKRIQSPLSDNPASVQRALQIAQSYRGKTGMETGTGSFYNIKQSMPVSDVRATIGDIPGISLKEKKPLSWEKFHDIAKGGSLINMGGDLSNFGRLTHINDKELAWPVDLHAGAKYMREPNPGQVWRNNKSHATGFMNKIKAEEAEGRDVYGILSPMGPTAVNSSHNMFDALMAQIPTANIKKDDLEAFDQAILNGEHLPADVRKNPAKFARAIEGLSEWPGIANAKAASEYARPQSGKLNGGHRSLIVDFMDKSRWRDKGFPEVGVTRAAITDPALKGISGNLLGHRVVKLSSKVSDEPELFEHSTYEKPSFGKYVGDVPLAQRHYVMPDVVERMIANPTQKGQVVHPYSEDAMGRSTARKLFEEQKQVQPINQRMLDSVMMDEENRQKYGLKKGGAVRGALMIAKGLKKR